MKSFKDISLNVLYILCILFIIQFIYIITIGNEKKYYYDDNEPLTYGDLQNINNNKCITKKEIIKSMLGGATRGAITGSLIGGVEGALCGSVVLGIINPLVLTIENITF